MYDKIGNLSFIDSMGKSAMHEFNLDRWIKIKILRIGKK